MTMTFETQILESFEKIGKQPRGNQVAYINQIVEAFLVKGKTNVVLSAPTGTGKSIIGAVVADVVHTILEIERCNSFILVGTNLLSKQYLETFDGNRDYLMVKGSNNYPCAALSTPEEPVFADSCCERMMRKSTTSDLKALAEKFCNKCEYSKLKKLKHITDNVITNYSYFFIDRLFSAQHAYRSITVWDEAHTINDAFAEHCAIYVSEKRLASFSEEISQNLKIADPKFYTPLATFREYLKHGTINDDNYLEKLKELHGFYTSVKELAATQAESNKNDLKLYTKLNKISKKFGDLACKIGDLLFYDFEHIFEYIKEAKEVSVKPVFVGEMFNQLINSDFQLFMSATVSDKLLIETLGLDPNTLEFIKLPPSFPVENKKLIFLNTEKLNYSTMKDEKVQAKLVKACQKIVTNHSSENESGIILTPSFDVTRMIASGLIHIDVKIFEHERGQKLAEVVEDFKNYSGKSVLISPSMFEGLSLDDDLSRYGIFVKAPFASLGEKRMKYIAEKHGHMYSLFTILKIIQGAGRSVRSESDYATTYCLDTQLSWLWKSPLNEWKSEFKVLYQ